MSAARRPKKHDLPPLPEFWPGMDRTHVVLPRHWIRAVRLHRNMSQTDVVRKTLQADPKCALSCPQLSKLEAGRLLLTDLPPEELEALRKALEVHRDIWSRVFQAAAIHQDEIKSLARGRLII